MSFLGPRPPWPPPPLIDLAAGADPGHFELTPELVATAADHRMSGLLWSWAREHAPDSEMRSLIAFRDLGIQAHLSRVWSLLESCILRLGEAGIGVASIKGPITESRWYSRPGERPSSDVDLWLSPHQIDRAGDALTILQPDHPWTPFFGELASFGQVETVTLRVEGIEVDLHLDLLKTGLPTIQANEIWEGCQSFELPGGTIVPVLDSAAALLHFLIHLNKDRFQRLLSYADIVRIIDSGVHWERLIALAEGEGLVTSVSCSLEAVRSDLGTERPLGVPIASGLRSRLWRLIWPRRVRLRGIEGRRNFRHRQLLIAALANRSAGEVGRAYSLKFVPPEPVLRLRATKGGRRFSGMRTRAAILVDRRRRAQADRF